MQLNRSGGKRVSREHYLGRYSVVESHHFPSQLREGQLGGQLQGGHMAFSDCISLIIIISISPMFQLRGF